jgi:hypothetical protein
MLNLRWAIADFEKVVTGEETVPGAEIEFGSWHRFCLRATGD